MSLKKFIKNRTKKKYTKFEKDQIYTDPNHKQSTLIIRSVNEDGSLEVEVSGWLWYDTRTFTFSPEGKYYLEYNLAEYQRMVRYLTQGPK